MIRSVLLPDAEAEDGAVKLFSAVGLGDQIQVCLSSPDALIGDSRQVAQTLNDLPFSPKAALVTSCAGRKTVLGDHVHQEIKEIVMACPSIEGLAGFPSFGEFAPVKTACGHSPPLFHNMTIVLLLIGEGEK